MQRPHSYLGKENFNRLTHKDTKSLPLCCPQPWMTFQGGGFRGQLLQRGPNLEIIPVLKEKYLVWGGGVILSHEHFFYSITLSWAAPLETSIWTSSLSSRWLGPHLEGAAPFCHNGFKPTATCGDHTQANQSSWGQLGEQSDLQWGSTWLGGLSQMVASQPAGAVRLCTPWAPRRNCVVHVYTCYWGLIPAPS